MMSETVVLQGIVKPDGTLELAGKVPLTPGPVEVTVKSVVSPAGADLTTFLARLRAEQMARGYVPRSAEAIDQEIQQMRDEWEERQQAIESLQDQCHARRGASNLPGGTAS